MGPEVTTSASLGAILLAAGSSQRLGQSKQLVEIDGQSLVVRQAGMLAGLGFAKVVVVTGAKQSEVTNLVEELPVSCVHNPEWAQGMGRSLALRHTGDAGACSRRVGTAG